MPRGCRTTVLCALLLVPVLCCVLGVGAFLHVAVSVVAAQEEMKSDMLRRIKELEYGPEELERELFGLTQRMAAVRQELAEQQTEARSAAVLKAELDRLQRQKTDLEARLAEAQAKMTRAQDTAAQTQEEIQREQKAMADAMRQAEETQKQVAQAEQHVARPGDAGRDPKAPDTAHPVAAQSSHELSDRLAVRQSALQEAHLDTEQLTSELAAVQRERTEKEKTTFKVETIKSTKNWNAPKPLYVVCDESGATVQPAGTQFSPFPDSDERLKFLAAAKKTGYVLFLIRPTGYQSFQQYRDAVESEAKKSQRAIHYGYEPVNEDWKLVFPKTGS